MMNNIDFQTPPHICDYMVSLLTKESYSSILEPTSGSGNLVKVLRGKSNSIYYPEDFFEMDKDEFTPREFDCIVMNPPFTPMVLGYKILFECIEKSGEIVALMPWLTVINSSRRADAFKAFGLKSVTHLPRNVFKGSRVQCCVIHLVKGWDKETVFKIY